MNISTEHQSSKQNTWLPWVFLVFFVFYILFLFQFPFSVSDTELAPIVIAEELLTNQFQYQSGMVLPPYFDINSPMDTGSLIYLLMIPFISLGKQIWVIRGISVIAGLLAAFWILKIAQDHLNQKHTYLLLFILAAMPAWVLLSRTGNSAIVRTAAYTAFLYYYLQYRFTNPKSIRYSLLAALVLFYSDLNGQLLLLLNGAFFLIYDFKYHWRFKKTFLITCGTILIGLLPWVRYLIVFPDVYQELFNNISLAALSPINWFYTSTTEPVFFLGYFQPISPLFLLLVPLGIFMIIRYIRKQTYWLWAMLVCPYAASIFFSFHPFHQAAVIPVFGLLILFLINQSYLWIWRSLPKYKNLVVFAVSILLGMYAVFFLWQGITQSTKWIMDFNKTGVQYGGREIFQTINQLRISDPGMNYSVTTGWSNNPGYTLHFFSQDLKHVQFNTIDSFIESYRDDIKTTIFVLAAGDLINIRNSGKFLSPEVITTIQLPDGNLLYSFVKLTYTPEIKSIISAEYEARQAMIETETTWENTTIRVYHPSLSLDDISLIFDQNPETLIKSDRINPMTLKFVFPEPVEMNGIQLNVGSEALNFFVTVESPNAEPQSFNQRSGMSDGNKTISIPFTQWVFTNSIEITIQDQKAPENGSIHLWDIVFNTRP